MATNNTKINSNLYASANKSLSRKSLTKLNNSSHINENVALPPQQQQQQNLQQHEANNNSSLNNRKGNNSWIAQSFRKAFGKIENRRRTSQLNKSQNQLNKSMKALSSTFSINTNANDYEFVVSNVSSQRNSSGSAKTNQISTSSNLSDSSASKRSSLSDDESALPAQQHNVRRQQQFNSSNKLSVTPASFQTTLNHPDQAWVISKLICICIISFNSMHLKKNKNFLKLVHIGGL